MCLASCMSDTYTINHYIGYNNNKICVWKKKKPAHKAYLCPQYSHGNGMTVQLIAKKVSMTKAPCLWLSTLTAKSWKKTVHNVFSSDHTNREIPAHENKAGTKLKNSSQRLYIKRNVRVSWRRVEWSTEERWWEQAGCTWCVFSSCSANSDPAAHLHPPFDPDPITHTNTQHGS